MASLRQSSPEDVMARHDRRIAAAVPQFSTHKTKDYSKVPSRVGSLSTAGHKPGGGSKKIVNQKTDYSHVSSRTDNRFREHYTPAGGNVRITSEPWKPAGAVVAPRTDSRNEHFLAMMSTSAKMKKQGQGVECAERKNGTVARPKVSSTRRASAGHLTSQQVQSAIERLSVAVPTSTTSHSSRRADASGKSSPSSSPTLSREPLKMRSRRGSRDERMSTAKLPLGLRRYASSSAVMSQRKLSAPSSSAVMSQRKLSAPACMLQTLSTSSCLLGKRQESSASADSEDRLNTTEDRQMHQATTMPTLQRACELGDKYTSHNGLPTSDQALRTDMADRSRMAELSHSWNDHDPPSPIAKENDLNGFGGNGKETSTLEGALSEQKTLAHGTTCEYTPTKPGHANEHPSTAEQNSFSVNGMYVSEFCTSTPKHSGEEANGEKTHTQGMQENGLENERHCTDKQSLQDSQRDRGQEDSTQAENERRKSSSTSMVMLMTDGEHAGSLKETEVSLSSNSSHSNPSSSSPEQTLAEELNDGTSASDDDNRS